MPIRYTKTQVHFEGRCAVEEALDLVAFLNANPRAKVSLGKCTGMHSALVQVLLALRPPVQGNSDAPDMVRLLPLLTAAPAASPKYVVTE
ncbi:hypothetical protein ACLBWH_06480 [Sphingomonas sp. M6A6_1c]